MFRNDCGVWLRFARAQSNYHRHVFWVDHIAPAREKVIVDRTRSSISAEAGGNNTGTRGQADNHTHKTKAGSTVGSATANISSAAAMQIVVTVGTGRCGGQHNLNAGGQVAG